MKKIFNTIIFLAAAAFNVSVVVAQSVVESRDLLPQVGANDAGSQVLPTGDLKYDILPRVLRIFFALSGALTTVIFVYSGVMLVTHLGNEEVLTKFKKALIFSGVGLGLITTAYGIVFGILKLNF
ncbi:hypothetical protein COV82_05600 [Candidatus Peregrinibacteria bacterium CG11_big_fil_rev_8_21_14_0_20_46_8]|nr:MAG: hypothetical protein COV82_05600 [Candidatus Peregrinibacteria bacterium CG11_big_fil_rev_8_21_14_0_20_46_8]